MKPIVRVKGGRKLGNAAACGELANMPPEAWRAHVNEGRPQVCPAPQHAEVDQLTRQKMWWLDEVERWDRERPGKGNWQGLGAKYRRAIIGSAECPQCHTLISVDDHGEFRRHFLPSPPGQRRVACDGGEKPAPGFEQVHDAAATG